MKFLKFLFHLTMLFFTASGLAWNFTHKYDLEMSYSIAIDFYLVSLFLILGYSIIAFKKRLES